ncbi:hypothetical protein MMPV_000313 [Pyropia vietnamensis]
MWTGNVALATGPAGATVFRPVGGGGASGRGGRGGGSGSGGGGWTAAAVRGLDGVIATGLATSADGGVVVVASGTGPSAFRQAAAVGGVGDLPPLGGVGDTPASPAGGGGAAAADGGSGGSGGSDGSGGCGGSGGGGSGGDPPGRLQLWEVATGRVTRATGLRGGVDRVSVAGGVVAAVVRPTAGAGEAWVWRVA